MNFIGVKVYCEPKSNGTHILKRKKAEKEILNFQNKNLYDLFSIIKERPEELKRYCLDVADYCDKEAILILNNKLFSDIDRAWAVLKLRKITNIDCIHNRIKDVILSFENPMAVIREYDSPDTLFVVTQNNMLKEIKQGMSLKIC